MKISEMQFEEIEEKIWPETTCMFTEVSDTFSNEQIKRIARTSRLVLFSKLVSRYYY